MSAVPPTWVLLRGLSRESGHWGRFPQELQAVLEAAHGGARLVMLDLPGNGSRYRETSPTQVPALVDRCREELAHLGVTGPVHLLAMSLGAMVAADWARRYPSELAGAVLINTSLRPFSPFYRRLLPMNYMTLMLLSLSKLGARQRESRVLAMTTRLLPDRDAVLDAWVAIHQRHPVRVLNIVRQLMAAVRYRASAARPGVPVLLLCSQADGLVDWRCSQAISRAWGAPLRLHTKAGHDLPLDDGPWVARAVVEWLRGLSAWTGLSA